MHTADFFSTGFVASLLVAKAAGHMIMGSPVPYGKDTLNNSPLDASGSDYPCKQRPGVYTISQMNNMKVGDLQPLTFIGSAVHEGGSCQVSVSLDKEPTASSTFKVIKSIEGACPGLTSGPLPYNFTVPAAIPNGQFTLAWTWFNKIGNREMYMNCAPITVTGGANDTSLYDKLPDMAVANLGIPQSTCKTTETFAYYYPNPVTSTISTLITMTGYPPASSALPSAAPSSITPSAAPSAASSSAASAMPSSTVEPTPAVSATSVPAAPSATGSATCTSDGVLICNGPYQWGLCNFGTVIWQPVAAGTNCTDGQIVKRSIRHRAMRNV
ncbi:lytic polysaccharide monooxygenase [Glonium stellatum]|uniref:Lytic polysaccharide monooxygenase n=1 Tax=Glonium stellatum TaxID=574774 RepID=A0A8E2JRZ8_9PEZI|nr:lytic polysaccharide monooxygenase [Glonium stellatum]